MKLIEGVKSDTSFEDQPGNSMAWAHNVQLSESFGAVTNELGFEILSLLPAGNLIGSITIWNNDLLVFLDTNVIGIVQNDIYTEVYADAGLNFSSDFPIFGVSRTAPTGDIEVTWTDRNNPMRFLNVTAQLEGRGVADVSQLDYLSPAIIPTVEIEAVANGGSLSAGAYRFATRYVRADGSKTVVFPSTGQVPIYEDSLSLPFEQISGSAGGTATSKQITLNINGVDTRYVSVEVIAIRRINEVVDAVLFATLPVISNCIECSDCTDTVDLEVPFTGSEVLTTVSLDEVFATVPRYNKASALTYHTDNRLYWGNLEREEVLDIQKYVNNFQLKWTTRNTSIDTTLSNSYKDGKYVYENRSFMPNEVYAFYFVPILNNGQLGEAYHIPGRLPTSTPLVPVMRDGTEAVLQEDASITDLVDLGYDLFEDDLLVDPEIKYFHTRNTATVDADLTGGEFGYWENADEEYPDTECSDIFDSTDSKMGSLRCENVRHHKFPSVRQLDQWGIPFIVEGDDGKSMPTLGIEISNIFLPDDVLDKVQGFYVFYATRTPTNSTVLGTSPVTYAGTYAPDEDSNIFDPNRQNTNGANMAWTFVGGLAEPQYPLYPDNVRLHSFAMLESSLPTTNFSFLRMEMRGTTGWELLSNMNTDPDGNNPQFAYHLRADWTNADRWEAAPDADIVRCVEEASYFGFDTPVNSQETNEKSEQCLRAKLKYNGTPTLNFEFLNAGPTDNVYPALTMPTPQVALTAAQDFDQWNDTNFVPEFTAPYIYTYFATLNQYVRNAFFNYKSQELVIVGNKATLFGACNTTPPSTTDSFELAGGDTFVGVWGFKMQEDANDTGLEDQTPAEQEQELGINKTLHIFPEYAGANINLRVEGETEAEAQWPSKLNGLLTDEQFLDIPYTNDNFLGYNSDYSWINNLNVTSVNCSCDAASQEITVHPSRIIRSLTADNTDGNVSWREYLPNDFYDGPRDRGPIFKLASYDDTIFIHHQKALFRTRGTQSLQTDDSSIFIGSGDIFANTPKELVPSNTGYAGIQSHFAGLVCKQGYAFVDQMAGRVFVVRDGIEEISSNGLLNYFQEFLPEPTIQTNPFTENSVVVGFDERYNRLLLTKVNNFTFGYAFDLTAWEGTKPYVPRMYITAQDQLRSVSTSNVFARHNASNRRGLFYDDIPQPSFVDVVLNPVPTETKMFSVITWITEVLLEDGTGKYNDSIDAVEVFTRYQYSGLINLSQWANYRNVQRTWRFNNFRDLKVNNDLLIIDPQTKELNTASLDLGKSFTETRRFIDKYIVVRLHYNNALPDQIIRILDVDVQATRAMR